MSEPREIHFTTHLKPEPSIVYIMDKCTVDIFTKQQDWAFVEKAAYERLRAEWFELKKALTLMLSGRCPWDEVCAIIGNPCKCEIAGSALEAKDE